MESSVNIRRVCLAIAMAASSLAASAAEPPRFEFTRMVAHWATYSDAEYLPFLKEAQPEVVQLGFYGGHFWSLAHTPQYKGYPAHFPHQGLKETGGWFEEKNAAIHGIGAKVVGHFNVEFLVGEPDGEKGPRGFFHFYRNLWNEDELGPKPVADPLEMMEKNADGTPITNSSYSIGGMREYWACLRNPNWQKVLKAWVKRGIDRGLDGYIANYFYRHNCLCEHCQSGFRGYMGERFGADELQKQFGISDVTKHKFKEIGFWHNPDESTPLKREMLRWSQISNKQVFDEVFHKYGRSLKPDLITAQWNHLGNFSQIRGDERCMLAGDVWGKDETYLWYSTGSAAFFTDIEKRYLGEGTLQARFIRGAFDDKPFTLGKYEGTRIRAAISELAANGGAPMGFYTRFTDPAAREVITRYYQFLKRYDSIYRASRSHAEAVLLFPRKAVHKGDVKVVETFRSLGAKLLDEHVLFDIVPDDLADEDRLQKYSSVVTTESGNVDTVIGNAGRSRFDLPWTVRVSASRPPVGDELTLHFVNYNRVEPPKDGKGKPSAGRGIVDEKPIASDGGPCSVVLPTGLQPKTVSVITPEASAPKPLEFALKDGRIIFRLPGFLVYSAVLVR